MSFIVHKSYLSDVPLKKKNFPPPKSCNIHMYYLFTLRLLILPCCGLVRLIALLMQLDQDFSTAISLFYSAVLISNENLTMKKPITGKTKITVLP